MKNKFDGLEIDWDVIQIDKARLVMGDCLEIMESLPDGSVDMILCDLPYGTTQNKWDSVIPFEPLWVQYKRICKGAIVLTATQPFSSALGASNIRNLKYSWSWVKPHTGQLNAKRMPLKNVEDILVFYSGKTTYNPQFSPGRPYTVKRKGYVGAESYGAQRDHDTVSDGARYPKQVLEFAESSNGRLHPTQKPVALMEYLIRTYTNAGEVIMDNTMGSGTTGVACVNTGRHFIGMEKDKSYFEIACQRIRDAGEL
jgi:site-specific DNA-methyltransferase (adenine-specific)